MKPLNICLFLVLVCRTFSQEVVNDAVTTQGPYVPTPAIDRSGHHYHTQTVDPTYKGVWKKKFVWRPRWVKTWQPKKIYVAVWKRMWGPSEINEWVPIPKPPPGWVKHSSGPFVVKRLPHTHHVSGNHWD